MEDDRAFRRPGFRAELDDEDERMAQDAFLMGAAPSAKAVRIKPRGAAAAADAAAAAAEPAAPPPPPPPPPPPKPRAAAPQPVVMGEVVERPRRAAGAPQPPAPPSAPFPVATHRRQSKFALGRQQQQQQQRSGGPSTAAAPAAARPPPAEDPAVPEARGVAADNAARLASMSAEEREEALEEVRGRLPPSAVEFLRRRGQQRAATGSAAGAATAAKAAAAAAAASPRLQPPPPPAPPPPPPPEKPATASLPPAGRVRFSLAADGAPVGVLPAAVEEAGTTAAASSTTPESALERDPLRFGPGSEGLGYTCDELAALARSAHAPQRQAALRGLAAVLRRARPAVADVRPLAPHRPSLRPRPLFFASSSSFTWSDVWVYLVVHVRVAIPLRAALDDAHGGATAAAAEALAALLAPSPQEALALEACCDGGGSGAVGGWPAPWSAATLRRAGPEGPWETAADLAAAAEEAAAAAAQKPPKKQGADNDDEEPPPAPEDISAVDPMCGFLATEPLPRVRFLLAQAAREDEGDPAARAAAPHLLAVLSAAVRSGPQAALAVARCPGLLATVAALLGQQQQQQQQQQEESDENGTATAPHSSSSSSSPTRLAAMALARALCQASAATAQLARSAGLLGQAQLALAEQAAAAAAAADVDTPAGPAERRHALLLRLEALRAWRAAALHGVLDPGMHMDVMYANGGLCELLAPPPADQEGRDDEEEDDAAAAAAALAWRLRAEALSVAAALVAHAQATSALPDAAPPGLSPGCAAALAEGAASDWLCNDVLRRVDEAMAAASASSSSPPTPPLQQWGAHPALALPPAAAPAAALAAAVQYLAAYWRSVGGPPRGDVRDALVGRLIEVGLLLPDKEGGEGDDGGDAPAAGAALLRRCCGCARERLDDGDDADDDGDDLLQAHATAAPALALVSAAAALAAAMGELPSARALARRALFGARGGGGLCEDALSLAERWSRRALCVMEPWHLMRALLWQPRLRLLTELARPLLLLQQGGDGSAAGDGAAAKDAAAETDLLSSALLAVPALGLPGAEADAMAALSLALSPACVSRPLARAQEALRALDESATAGEGRDPLLRPAGLAAQGASRWWEVERDKGAGAPVPFRYPLPSPLPTPAQLSEALTEGYAAAWLSMVPQQALQAGGAGDGGDEPPAGNANDNAAAAAAFIPLRRPMLDEGTGSRLPLPAHWILTEILAVPRPTASASASDAQPPPPPPHAAGAALLWVLGLDSGAPSVYLERAVPHVPARLQGVLRLAYMFNTQELMTPGGGGAGGGKGAAATAAAAAATAAALEDPLVRWPLAALAARWTHRAVSDWREGGVNVAQTPVLWNDALFVQRLAELAGSSWAGADLAAASHAALALSPALASPAARAAAWRALADADALERLPPAAACPGGASAYCCPLGSEGCRCFGDGGGEGESTESSAPPLPAASYFPPSARELSSACAHSLAQGRTSKSAALGGLAAAVAVHAVAARALADDAAWSGSAGGGGGGGGQASATNVLRGVVRGAPPGTARALVRCAARCGGVGTREATRRAVVACHGDAELMGALARDGVV